MEDKILKLISENSTQDLVKMVIEESEAIHEFLGTPKMVDIWSAIAGKELIEVQMKIFDYGNKGEGIYNMLVEQNKKDGIQTN